MRANAIIEKNMKVRKTTCPLQIEGLSDTDRCQNETQNHRNGDECLFSEGELRTIVDFS